MLISVVKKLKENRWVGGISRQRQQYWWKGFQKQLLRAGIIGESSMEELRRLLHEGIIVVTHSVKYCERRCVGERTNLSFASTDGVGFG